jgi:ubiquinone/menaquinone biosynthesis C-methylase UbiE
VATVARLLHAGSDPIVARPTFAAQPHARDDPTSRDILVRMADWRLFDSVAEIYDRVRGPVHAGPARDLVDLASPPLGGRVLDVGTGTGVAAQIAAEAVGPSGVVVGIDPSLPMLQAALPRHGRVAAAQAIDLPFRDETFDVILANFVIAFFAKYETALFDILRVLRPGGTLAVSWWEGGLDEFGRTWTELAETFATKELLRDAVQRAIPGNERFRDSRRLEETLRDVGLREVRVHRRQYRTTTSQADYLAGRETSSEGRFLRETLGDRLWERFRERVTETFRQRFPDPMGDTNDVLIAVGTKERN